MAGIVDDIVTQVLQYAGKTVALDAIVRGRVFGVIDAINREMNNFTVASRKKDIAVAASAQEVTMPAVCKRIIELGRYDSATDRISTVYDEISEQEFHAVHSGETTLQPIDPTLVNQWCLLDNINTGAMQIRLVYPPSSAFTMEARFYEPLTDQNVDRLESKDILFNGAVARLGAWFPVDAGLAYRLYIEALDTLRASRRSIKRTIREHVRRDIAIHNAVAGSLVD